MKARSDDLQVQKMELIRNADYVGAASVKKKLDALLSDLVADDDDDDDWGEGASDTEGSDSGEELAPQATKLLRQLRGAAKMEELDRSSEVQRKSTVVRSKHNFYKQTKVTSHAQEEQSALPAGVTNVYEDSTDEEEFTGEQKEIEK